ncbi:MAG TPA: signal peptidase I [Actinomycetota bacterium]|nr:signal peptidase I [Actinomycetota bacterium]
MREQRYHGHLKGFFPLAAAAMLVWWRWRPFLVEVEGESMAPTLRPGDYLVAVRLRRVRRGSLVVVEHPDRPGYEMVKRVAALPGERVEDRILGTDEYWVTGDNVDGSSDSRNFGPVGPDVLRGRVVLRYWPARRTNWFG